MTGLLDLDSLGILSDEELGEVEVLVVAEVNRRHLLSDWVRRVEAAIESEEEEDARIERELIKIRKETCG